MVNNYQECLDRLYYTTSTEAHTGISRKDAYSKLQELVDMYEEMRDFPTKLEAEVERLRAENEMLESKLCAYEDIPWK